MNNNNYGHIQFKKPNGSYKMDELWFNTGSICNLTCIHCYVESSPQNDYLNFLTLEDIQPELETAQKYGVDHVYFTGGEPFVNKQILSMIEAASNVGNVTILTNGTKILRKHIQKLLEIRKQSPYDVFLRISLDHFQPARHDLLRGAGKFNETVETIKILKEAGFPNIIITPTAEVYRGSALNESQVRVIFRNLFRDLGISVEVKVIPAILDMGAQVSRTDSRTREVYVSQLEVDNTPEGSLPQCYYGRTVQKVEGTKSVMPCPILYEKEFEMGSEMEATLAQPTPMNHKECYNFCFAGAGKCGN